MDAIDRAAAPLRPVLSRGGRDGRVSAGLRREANGRSHGLAVRNFRQHGRRRHGRCEGRRRARRGEIRRPRVRIRLHVAGAIFLRGRCGDRLLLRRLCPENGQRVRKSLPVPVLGPRLFSQSGGFGSEQPVGCRCNAGALTPDQCPQAVQFTCTTYDPYFEGCRCDPSAPSSAADCADAGADAQTAGRYLQFRCVSQSPMYGCSCEYVVPIK